MINAIIVAAGSGKRVGADVNKVLLKILGKPVIIYTLEKFYTARDVDEIYLVIRKEDDENIKSVLNEYNMSDINIVYGGKERQDSIYNALMQMNSCDTVIIHDGARPLIEESLVEKCIFASNDYNAICVGMPAKDTIKKIDSDTLIESTPDRNTMWIAQTPQVFKYELIKSAYEYAKEKNISATDDASLVECLGEKVKMIEGSYSNIKITTAEDLMIAETLIKNQTREKSDSINSFLKRFL